MKKLFRIITAAVTVAAFTTLSICGAAAYNTPDSITVCRDSSNTLNGYPLSIRYDSAGTASGTGKLTSGKARLLLFGALPVKSVDVSYSDRKTVILGGEPFGIRLYTNGLVVSRISGVAAEQGETDPAGDAGVQCGDIITAVDNVPLVSAEQLSQAAINSAGKKITLSLRRGKEAFDVSITPQLDKETGDHRIGIWVRDSCAGIGTMTFKDPESNTFAGLGHGIYDSDSGSLMPLLRGDIVDADIITIDKSFGGNPGSLCGAFSGSESQGRLISNEECGLYGSLKEKPAGESITIGLRQETVRGRAKLRTTLEGNTPSYYDIEITEINYNNNSPAKNMVIHVTDGSLLEKTGGIVQGMSGSPVIQNGRLVGAVTHVFVNDPSYGYAVFAENMLLSDTRIVQKEKQKIG